MKMSLGLILLMSLPAMAQRMNECPRPGQILHTDYTGETSDAVSRSHTRQGDHSIPQNAMFNGGLRTKIYKNYTDRICRSESYIHQERICDRVSPDLALGRGNQVLASLYDLHNSTLKRADIFARNVRFQQASLPSDRLESATQVVTVLAKAAAVSGLPRSWEEFSVVLQGGVVDGSLSQFVVDEIILTNAEANKRALGFYPLQGVKVTEGNGNGRLNQIFDLGLSPEHRAKRIEKLITGVNARTARALSSQVVIFAAANGIPNTWNQFVLMMRDARNANIISDRDLREITVDYEDVNRDAMGFQITAELCRVENQTRYHNVVRVDYRKILDREVSHNYQIKISGAPLVNGESENFYVSYDGFSAPKLTMPNTLNSYNIAMSQNGDSISFDLTGKRNQVKPQNTLKVKLNRSGKVSTLQIQNTNYNPSVGGKILVRVKFYNDRFLRSSQHLATETYELTDGNLKVITAAIRNKEVDFVQASMQITGSSYFSSEFSDEIKAKD